eukprot:TRINITY_DN56701_c0_g1_i1.p1 TRINITY_DN56701_c0_g1~~TRINITY_DN56701_c0_g1_i1.p1  ORF type:complete len:524 (-),score=99.79 TRINITY_DN56701_c0_g1_i1:113-1684(-)
MAKAADEVDDFDDGGNGFLDRVFGVAKKCLGRIAKGSPPEPCPEVADYLATLKISQRHLLQIYDTFHYLKQMEDEDELITSAHVVSSDVVPLLIEERRKYVVRMLRCILKLGDCEEETTWDNFLWVMLRFCSLNKVELAQTLFLCILRIRDSSTYHYIRAQELQEFFSVYKNCPVRSFDTSEINFELLPLRRYYMSDFSELLMRFTLLLNPILHLQQSLQAKLPSTDFWDNSTGSVSFCRKITFDFFMMETGRIYLRGEPPFRETCDMLCPDALGCVPINQDQWILRTWVSKGAQGLVQLSVWGEQASPEVMEIRQLEREEQEERDKYLKAKEKAEEEDSAEKLAEIEASGITTKSKDGTSNSKIDATEDKAEETEEDRERRKKEAIRKAGEALTAQRNEEGPALDVSELTRTACVTDEQYAAPVDLLPPPWMFGVAVAPPRQSWMEDPPLPQPLKEPEKDRTGIFAPTMQGMNQSRRSDASRSKTSRDSQGASKNGPEDLNAGAGGSKSNSKDDPKRVTFTK